MKNRIPAFAVVRVDLEAVRQGVEWSLAINVKEVLGTKEAAEAEVERLNKLNGEKGDLYMCQYTRVEPGLASAELAEHSTRLRRAKEIQEAIGMVLLHDWDPIGIRAVPQAQDEYESYVGPVYRLIASGASAETVADYLVAIEEDMGVGRVPPRALVSVAEKLCALDVRISPK
jgi:hypothetical protein